MYKSVVQDGIEDVTEIKKSTFQNQFIPRFIDFETLMAALVMASSMYNQIAQISRGFLISCLLVDFDEQK